MITMATKKESKNKYIQMPALEKEYADIIKLFYIANKDNEKGNRIEKKIEPPKKPEDFPDEMPDLGKLIDETKKRGVTFIKNKDYFSNTKELMKEIYNILISNGYLKESAEILSKDMVWSEDFFILFLLKYSNTDFLNRSYIDKYLHETFAGKLYKRSIVLDSKREELNKNTWSLDEAITNEILNNKKIVFTIFCIGERIYNFFDVCNKISFTLSNILFSNSKNNYSINETNVWFITKSLIRELSTKDFDDKNYLFFKFFSTIEYNLNICFNTNSINNIINDNLVITSLKKIINWYNSDFEIVLT